MSVEVNPYLTAYRIDAALPAHEAAPNTETTYTYAYAHFDTHERSGVSVEDNISADEEEEEEDEVAVVASDLFALDSSSVRTCTLPVFQRSRHVNKGGEFGPFALKRRKHARYVPGLDRFFCYMLFELLDGQLEAVAKLVASPGADATRQPEVMAGAGEYHLQAEESESGPTPGNFGTVSVQRWTPRDDSLAHKEQRVFVKQQERSSQFFIEVACLSTATDFGLPTPRLLALHQDVRSQVTTTVLALSKGRPANKFFAVGRPLEVKLRAAMMFAFALQCCHRHGIVHSDVALKNFMLDGESCFEIVDFGLSVVGQLGHQSAKARKHNLADSFPYPHKAVACMQAAPELFVLHEVSAASDMWQFAFALLDIFLGSSTASLSPFLQKHVVPHFPAPRQGAADTDRYRADMIAFVSEFLPTLRTLVPAASDEFPEDMRDLVIGCLHPNPNRRVGTEEIIETAGALLGEPKLSHILAGCVSLPEASLRLEGTTFAALLPTPEETMNGDVVSGVRAVLEASSDEVDLASRLGSGVWGVVLEGLAQNDVLKRLDLYANAIGEPKHMGALARALTGPRSISCLHELHVGSNLIGDSGAAQLARILGTSNRGMKLLDAWNNEISDGGAEALAEHLTTDSVLERLLLRGNQIGSRGAGALGTMLHANATLLELNVGRNPLGSDGVVALVQGVSENHTLERLWLREVEVDAQAAAGVSAMLRVNTSLLYLNLRSSSLGPEGVTLVCDGLKHNTTLRELNVRACALGDAGAAALGELFATESCALTHVDAARNNIGPDGVASIFRGVEANRSLVELDVSRSRVEGKAVELVASAIRLHPRLEQLSLEGCGLDEAAGVLVAAALEQTAALRHVDLDRNRIGAAGGARMVEALKVNHTLHRLLLKGNRIGQPVVDALLQVLQEHNHELKDVQLKGNDAVLDRDALDPALSARVRG